jgi:predicted alpha/beta-fold hydrolase
VTARPETGRSRESGFSAPRWLRNRHLQTILPNSPLRPRCRLLLRNEVLELPDGDFLRLEWLDGDGPLVVMLHGLEGSSRSRYARGIMAALGRAGYQIVLMSFRGCGGVPNRLPRSYHAGDTADLSSLLAHVSRSRPGVPVAALGYSLGGNALLKYLGEAAADTCVRTAVAVSVPFDLQDSCAAMSLGVARLYQGLLLGHLKDSTRRKFATRPPPFDLRPGLGASDFEGFDDRITAPLHGFADAPDYYRKSSCRAYLKHIHVPTLLVHAADDPFMTRASIPAAAELAPSVTLELSEHGGHVGFVAGDAPWNLRCWLEDRIVRHFNEALMTTDVASAASWRTRLTSRSRRRKPRAAQSGANSAAAAEKD